jgi:hypothetical protein
MGGLPEPDFGLYGLILIHSENGGRFSDVLPIIFSLSLPLAKKLSSFPVSLHTNHRAVTDCFL